ncbi:MAG: MFS transporter [Acidobacteriota bacterium]|nr:MAG: MFS transporter [Acidobacteriota bacterium]
MKIVSENAKRIALFTLLYFSEGAPIGFIWWALPTLLRTRGLAVERITGLTAMLVLPWTLKFLWSPLVDTLRTRRSGYRGWIMAAQFLMGASLIPLIGLDVVGHYRVWQALLLAHAVCAATQDVAIDALAIRMVAPGGRGALNGGMQAGMLLGRSLFGGAALLLAAKLGWNWIFVALIGCIWVTMAAVFFIREPEEATERGSFREFGLRLREAARHRSTWLGMVFALVSAAAFESVGAMAGPYLIDRGASSDEVGLFFAVPVVVATIAGGLIGGRLSDRWGRIRSVAVFLIGFVSIILALGAADGRVSKPVIFGLLAGLYLFIGLFTAASYALFMDLTDPRLGGTQFSAYMAATNGCESWSGWAGGRLAARSGYASSFFVMSLFSILSLFLLRLIAKVAIRKE